MKLTARHDKFKIKSQSKPNFASVNWRKTASGGKSKVRALTHDKPHS